MKRIEYNLSVIHSKEEWLKKRTEVITSSDVSALFNLHDYGLTPYKLFTNKKNKTIEAIDNPYVRWGNHLQRSIAIGFSKEYGLDVKDFDKFVQCPEQGIGSSFDYLITGKSESANQATTSDMTQKRMLILSLLEKHGEGILEIKNVHTMKALKDWDTAEATAYIELQLQHQLLVSGKKWGVIAGLVGGCDLQVFVREADPKTAEQILSRTQNFWFSVVLDKAPPKVQQDYEDHNKQDRSFTDGIIDGTQNSVLEHLAEEYATQRAFIAEAKKKMELLKYNIFEELGDAKGAEADYWKITTSTTKESPEVTVTIGEEHVGETLLLRKKREASTRLTVTIKGLDL